MDANSPAEDAGRLLAYALSRNRGMDATHRELLRRYRSDGPFRGVVEAVARGLGLRILDALDTGLVLAADADSPFAFKLVEFRQGMSVEDRLCHGIIQIAIAAYCFPTAASIEDDDRTVVPVAVYDIVDYLKAACTELQRRATTDPDMARAETQEAWRLVLSRPDTRETPDGRRAPGTLAGMVAWALERLAQEGLFARRDGDERGGRWQFKPAYRVQVRQIAAHEAYALITTIDRGHG